MNSEDLGSMSLEKLKRKENQHWEMAGCARQDSDKPDEKRHTDLARKYAAAYAAKKREESL